MLLRWPPKEESRRNPCVFRDIQFSRCWWEAGSRWGRPPNCPMRSAEGEKVRPAPLFDRWGRKALDLFGRGENRREGIFLPVRKSPFTNTAKSPLFCSPKVNISILFTKGLQYREILGLIYIKAGLCCVFLPCIFYEINPCQKTRRRSFSCDGSFLRLDHITFFSSGWPVPSPVPRPKGERAAFGRRRHRWRDYCRSDRWYPPR